MSDFLLFFIGVFVGTLGTLIGAGGGFILVPALLILNPNSNPSSITSLSLAIVFINALSGSISYSKLKRIDYKTAIYFALATIPGSILGVTSISYISRNIFNKMFGLIMILLSVYLFIKKETSKNSINKIGKNIITREIIDSNGNIYTYSFNMKKGVIFSSIVGFFSSLLGIGGGILLVPFMINALSFPLQIATATSQFILMIMSFSGTITNILSNKIEYQLDLFIYLSLGVIFGAQLGAFLSQKLKNKIIIRLLSISLGLSGFKIFLS